MVVAAALSLVIVVVALRGAWRGYEPTSDIAVIELRAREVLTRDNPTIGTWSSGSLGAERDFNHPGPLQFALYAVPVRLFGAGAGLAVGTAMIHVVAVWAIVLAARWIGGPRAALVAAVVSAVLAWNMGSEVLYDAWPPNAVLLAFLAMCVLAWAVAVGGLWALVPAVIAGSLAFQSQLSYVFLVPIVLGVALVSGVLARRAAGTGAIGRPLVSAAAVWLVLWAPPLWEQLANGGDGNLSRLAGSGAGGGGERLGMSVGTRVFGSVVALPSGWVRPGYDEAIPTRPLVDDGGTLVLDTSGIAHVAVVALALLIAVAVLGWIVRDGHRHGERAAVVGAGLVGAALASAWVTVLILPVDVLGLTPHKVRFLWAVAAFMVIVIVTHAAAVFARRRRTTWWAAGAMLAGLVVAVLTVPTSTPTTGPVALRSAWPAVRALRSQMGALEDVGTILFDPTGLYYLEPYTWPLMAELERRGIPFVVDGPAQRQLGGSHHRRGADNAGTVFVRVGAEAEQWPAGTRRIAFVDDPVTGPAAVFFTPS